MKYYPHVIEMDKTQKCSTLPKQLPLSSFQTSRRGKKFLLQTVSYLYRSAACLQACTGLTLGWVTGFTGLTLRPLVEAAGKGQSEQSSVIWV